MMQFRWLMLSGLLLWGAATEGAEAELAARLLPLAESHRGEVAIAVQHLGSGESFGYRADVPMPTASLIKFPVMVEAYRQAEAGEVDLEEFIELRDEDKVPGSGILTPHFSAGARIRLTDAVRLMIAYSDNTATNLVLDKIGIRSTADQMERMGLSHTKLHAKVYRRETSVFPDRSREFGLGSSTAEEMVQLLSMLHSKKLITPPASSAMLDHLLQCDDRSKLVRDLPPGTRVAHKSGAVAKARCDAGIIFSPAGPIAVCVMTRDNADMSWGADNQAHALCARVGRIVFDHFVAPQASRADDVVLRSGASGVLVERLQRTLNAVLEPSPELAVDGDFGPQTEAAVVRFQEARQLAASGRVDETTWLALGPLVTGDAPVPAPEVVNAEELPREPPDPLAGPPLVTCRAWAIADAKTGQLRWSHRPDRRLDIASTTKLMTAYLVLKYAADHPEQDVLEEQVVFSRRADRTRGSTSGVAEGERLTVAECLYGLLLPSGNDASVALAEHFGDRLTVDRPAAEVGRNVAAGDDGAPDPLNQFVEAMNRTAADLGMAQTGFRNPHGLTAAGHVSTARDLLRLAHAAWQMPRFRQYVETRQHGCTLEGPGGYRRNVVWKNTNQLLRITGYHGLKTGTTTAAGACLVSTGKRHGDQLMMVVLGASSSAARYVDSRNLYRWAWLEMGHKAD